jgi:hypothetical protein
MLSTSIPENGNGDGDSDDDDDDDIGPRSLTRQASINSRMSLSASRDDGQTLSLGPRSPMLRRQASLRSSGSRRDLDKDGPLSPSMRRQRSLRALVGSSSSSRRSVGGRSSATTDGPRSPSLRKKVSIQEQPERNTIHHQHVKSHHLLDDDDMSAVTFDTIPSTPDSSERSPVEVTKRMIDQCDDELSVLERDLEQGNTSEEEEDDDIHAEKKTVDDDHHNSKDGIVMDDDFSMDSRAYAEQVLARCSEADILSPKREAASVLDKDPRPHSKKMSISGFAMELSGLMKDDSPGSSAKASISNLFEDPPDSARTMSLMVLEEFLDEDEDYDDDTTLDSSNDNTKNAFSKRRERRKRRCLIGVALLFVVFAIGIGTGMWFSKQKDVSANQTNGGTSMESGIILDGDSDLPSDPPQQEDQEVAIDGVVNDDEADDQADGEDTDKVDGEDDNIAEDQGDNGGGKDDEVDEEEQDSGDDLADGDDEVVEEEQGDAGDGDGDNEVVEEEQGDEAANSEDTLESTGGNGQGSSVSGFDLGGADSGTIEKDESSDNMIET